jgi:hypothetical protein
VNIIRPILSKTLSSVLRSSAWLLLLFYSLGTILLPAGNFSSLNDLPAMYRHCKATEDKDLTPFDFITDHLINIDGLFDAHEQGDEQKPHTPFAFQHHVSVAFTLQPHSFTLQEMVASNDKPLTHWGNPPLSDYHAEIFRPPLL